MKHDILRGHRLHGSELDGLTGLGDKLIGVSTSFGRMIKVALIVGGALLIMAVTFVAVASYELLTSKEARLITQAAKDRAHSAALDVSSAARCDLLISQARAAGQPLPPCATQQRPANKSLDSGEVASALIQDAFD
jgi:apolipoprotein N-acyltransferase